jgi:hypothetical protein
VAQPTFSRRFSDQEADADLDFIRPETSNQVRKERYFRRPRTRASHGQRRLHQIVQQHNPTLPADTFAHEPIPFARKSDLGAVRRLEEALCADEAARSRERLGN